VFGAEYAQALRVLVNRLRIPAKLMYECSPIKSVGQARVM